MNQLSENRTGLEEVKPTSLAKRVLVAVGGLTGLAFLFSLFAHLSLPLDARKVQVLIGMAPWID